MNEDTFALLNRWPMATEFNLPPDSEVVVIGSYKGITMELLDDLWHPKHITGFDPQIWACDAARIRLKGRDNCEVIEYALGRYNTTLKMGEWHTDACSFLLDSREMSMGHIWDVHQVFSHRYEHIDLLVMNVEGYEFILLPYMEEKGWLHKIDRLAIQWHLGLGNDPKTDNDVADQIDSIGENGLKLVIDERPNWTYHERTVSTC